MKVETKIYLNKFKLRDYQKPIYDALENKKYKKILYVMPRRAGKDITAWNLTIRQAIKRVGVYYYIFPTYAQGKKALWDSVTIDGQKFIDFLPPELITSKNSQEMKLILTNGSLIQIVGSDNIDRLVGTNPCGCVFSEFALQDPKAYQLIRPILIANDGFVLIESCVSPNTLVITFNGLKRIKNVSKSRKEYTPLNKPIFGLNGFNNATDFYYGGKQKTLKITLMSGYQIECTPIHPLWSVSKWIKSKDLKAGDLIPIQYGQNIFGKGLDISDFKYECKNHYFYDFPLDLNGDLFYLLGLIHGDGSYDKNKVTITNKKDIQIHKFLRSKKFVTYGKDKIHYSCNSQKFCAFLEYLGFKHGAKNKIFPEKLFECNKQQLKSFLQGIFDADGCSISHPSKRGSVKFTSTCKQFIKDLQIILLNFGIAASLRKEEKKPTKKVKVFSTVYNLEINGYFAHVFYTQIGFKLVRKQRNKQYIPEKAKIESGNVYPVDVSKLKKRGRKYKFPKNIVKNPSRMTRRMIKSLSEKYNDQYLKSLIKEKLFYSPIKSIEHSESEVFDFVIPKTHSFFSNGFLSHNTPRGKNHFYELYQIAKNASDWFCYHLTLDDTKHIDPQEIEKDIQQGIMSRDLALQEYYCDFSLGVEGSYYAKYIDRMRLNNQISDVPWEPDFPVYTAWDLGMRDSTIIIFFQKIGQVIRIIDVYEGTGKGLEHYAKLLTSKPYTYGKHFAPHDIKVRELGTGLSRLEKARNLGIEFVLTPNLSIEDGIESVRSSLTKIWIDENKCETLIKALEQYRKEYDSKRKIYKNHHLHDWTSNYADAVRYLCLSLPKTRDSLSAQELEKRYQSAVYDKGNGFDDMFDKKFNTHY